MFYEKSERGARRLIRTPVPIIDSLLDKREHTAPQVTGATSRTPIVLPNGEILSGDGLHEKTGLYLMGANVPGAGPHAQEEATAALARIKATLFGEFEFESDLDIDAAVGGLFTGVQRRLLDKAPGFAAIAAKQSSGKTTLAEMIHIVLTGHDMPVCTFPENDEAEVAKSLLAMLLRSPAMVCFDNIGDGTKFRSSSIATALTSRSYTQRLLGHTKQETCPTNVLFAITGNNSGWPGRAVPLVGVQAGAEERSSRRAAVPQPRRCAVCAGCAGERAAGCGRHHLRLSESRDRRPGDWRKISAVEPHGPAADHVGGRQRP